MTILAFETSCDDTCAAIVKAWGSKNKPRFKILSNIISSQVKVHQKYGGVYPSLAKREHLKNLPLVFKKALRQAQGKLSEMDLIAVTVGPGLEPCLWTGINFAKELAQKQNLPIVPVNHIESHLIANLVYKNRVPVKFPAIGLVVSGGHTQLILMKRVGEYKILGETRDDAAGECFDKVAKILSLGYPGGPIIEKMAKKKIDGSRISINLPRPMISQKNYDLSFSGLKTAVLYDYKSRPEKIRKSDKYIKAMAAETQQAVIDVLIHKTLRTARDYRAKTILLGGGVASNSELRRQFKSRLKKESLEFIFAVPPKELCTDNAAMVAAASYLHWPQRKIPLEKIEAKANLRIS